MKNTQIAGLFVTALLFTACKKENLVSKASPSGKVTTEAPTRAPKLEGIKSFDYYDQSTNAASIGFYEFLLMYQQAQTSVPLPIPADNTVLGYGATTNGIQVIAYRDANGNMHLLRTTNGTTYADAAINNGTFSNIIEEIEVHPLTGEIYMLVQVNNNKVLYRVVMNTAVSPATATATALTVNGSASIFTRTNTNGYKSGSLAFVPDNGSSYELVFTHEYSNSVSTSGTISTHYTIPGTGINITTNSSTSRTYPLIYGSGNLNTTYGNGKLYFARNGLSFGSPNAVYALSLTSNTVTSEGFNVTNINDFGYWKEQ